MSVEVTAGTGPCAPGPSSPVTTPASVPTVRSKLVVRARSSELACNVDQEKAKSGAISGLR